jgi:hypothetical protein
MWKAERSQISMLWITAGGKDGGGRQTASEPVVSPQSFRRGSGAALGTERESTSGPPENPGHQEEGNQIQNQKNPPRLRCPRKVDELDVEQGCGESREIVWEDARDVKDARDENPWEHSQGRRG